MADLSILRAMKLWFFVIALSFFVIVGSIAVHESGHGIVAALTGCTVESIMLFSPHSNPATYISCGGDFKNMLVSISGMLFNFIFGTVFLFSNKKLINNVAYMFFGFGLYSGKLDLQSIGFPILLSSIISLAGICLMMYSLFLLCRTETLELFSSKAEGGVAT